MFQQALLSEAKQSSHMITSLELTLQGYILSSRVHELRTIIQEGLRVQRGGADPVNYIDAANAVRDVVTRQNHVIFGRRGCGKTLLLHESVRQVKKSIRIVYINCEDYKQHSFPNVLIEILDQLFGELESHLPGWFGRKRKSRVLIREIRAELSKLQERADEVDTKVKETASREGSSKGAIGVSAGGLTLGAEAVAAQKAAIEEEYERHDSKIHKLNLLLPRLKKQISEFFDLSKEVKTIYLQLDDFYHLPRTMQPHVADYIHRLCKDIPIFFKIATLRHATVLYADRGKQPTGAQERNDYQPINVDFTLADFKRTSSQLRRILYSYGARVKMKQNEVDGLFRGLGFDRLVLASGGVPRDFLALLLEVLAPKMEGEEIIGKDDVRLLSLGVFQKRIEELKTDSEQQDQDALLRGIYAIRKFCLEKQVNVFLVPDQALQEQDGLRELLNRLLDYRIIHSVGGSLTHKTSAGTFAAFMIDIGAYANLRKLEGRFREIDITAADAKEQCRNSPILDRNTLDILFKAAPPKIESALLAETEAQADE
jgi:Cdc6-like AAA superfamily ATPase